MAPFDYAKAFGVPVKVMNDAAMQALGSYKGGTMMFLGLGTGLERPGRQWHGGAMELGHLTYRQATYEDYLGSRGSRSWASGNGGLSSGGGLPFHPRPRTRRRGHWRGNVNKLDKLPPGCRAGDNALAFCGGFLLWEHGKARRKRSKTILAATKSRRL